MPARRGIAAAPFISSDMTRLKKPPAHGGGPPNAVYSLDEASTARHMPSDWSDLPPEVRDIANRAWANRPLDINLLRLELTHYWDSNYICSMMEHGIRVGDPDTPLLAPYHISNAPECVHTTRYANFLRESIATELSMNRTTPRPLSCPPSDYVHSVFIKDESKRGIDKFRDIHHLSAPRGRSVNDTIRYAAFHWVTAEQIAARVGPSTQFAKIDLKRYYRHFLCDPADWHKLAFELFGQEYWDMAMQWGLRNAVEIAHRFTAALVHIFNVRAAPHAAAAYAFTCIAQTSAAQATPTHTTLAPQRHGVTDAFGTIDDFLFLASTEELIEQSQRGTPDSFTRACAILDRILGPDARNTKPSKSNAFASCTVYCGTEWSADGARISPEFKCNLQDEVARILANWRATTAATMSTAIGRLVYAGTTQWGIRTFIGPLLALQAKISDWPDFWKVTLAKQHKVALQQCLEVLNRLDGMRLVLGDTTPHTWTETDAAGYASAEGLPAAIGIFYEPGNYIRMTAAQLLDRFTDAPHPTADIAIFEAYAPLVALRLQPQRYSGRLLGFLLDNPAAAAVLGKLRGPTQPGPLQTQLQQIAEAIFWELTQLNARITRIDLVPGSENPRADAVSRGQWDRLEKLLAR